MEKPGTHGNTFVARGLTKTYVAGAVEIQALRGIDFAVRAGEIVVLLGPSGSGKSTLLNIMGGLDRATSGQLLFKDQELTNLSERWLTTYRRDHVGFVFQFYNLVPSLTAYENVALVTEISAHPMRPDEALALVGLEDRMSHFPAELSGGEQQRVAIARAIAKRPDVLLCDEPAGALDSKTGIRVIEALLTVSAELGTTTLQRRETPQLDRQQTPDRAHQSVSATRPALTDASWKTANRPVQGWGAAHSMNFGFRMTFGSQ